MSFSAVTWAMEQDISTSSNKFVLIVLANFCRDTGESSVSISTISRITSLTEDTVARALKGLIEKRIIQDTGKTVDATLGIKTYKFVL